MMNPIRWLAARLDRYAYKASPRGLALVASWLANVLWTFDTTWQSLIREGFGRNAIVYACIRILSQSIPEARLTAYQGQGDKREELPPDNALCQLLRQPNELMTTFEMIELTTIHLSVVGRSIWWKERSVSGQVIALWPLRPDRVAPVYSSSQRPGERVLTGWAYQPPDASNPVIIPRQDAIAYNFPDPDGESGGIVEGLGPLSAIARQVAADNQATTHVGALLANYAQPGIALKVQDPIDETTANLIKAKFRQEFGSARLGTPAILDAGAEIQTLGFTLSDLEFPELRANAEARICAAFGIPPILVGVKVGLDRSTFSNMAEARQFFAETTCSWYWRRFADQLTNDLAIEFGDDLSIEFDTSDVRALAGQKIERLVPIKDAFAAGVITVNQYRQALELPPLDPANGDVLYVPNNVTIIPATNQARIALEKRRAAEQPSLPLPSQPLQLPTSQESEQHGQEEGTEEALPEMPLQSQKSSNIVVIPLDDELAEAIGTAPGGYLVARNESNGSIKYNPYHDQLGRFTSGGMPGGVYIPQPGSRGFRLDVSQTLLGPPAPSQAAYPDYAGSLSGGTRGLDNPHISGDAKRILAAEVARREALSKQRAEVNNGDETVFRSAMGWKPLDVGIPTGAANIVQQQASKAPTATLIAKLEQTRAKLSSLEPMHHTVSIADTAQVHNVLVHEVRQRIMSDGRRMVSKFPGQDVITGERFGQGANIIWSPSARVSILTSSGKSSNLEQVKIADVKASAISTFWHQWFNVPVSNIDYPSGIDESDVEIADAVAMALSTNARRNKRND